MKKSKQPKTFEDAIDVILARMRETMIKKQKDYGPKNILDFGEVGVALRCNDKLARLKNLYGIADGSYQRKQASNESFNDNWLDLANYGLIAQMLIDGNFELPLAALNKKSK